MLRFAGLARSILLRNFKAALFEISVQVADGVLEVFVTSPVVVSL